MNLPISILSLDQLTRDYWGSYDPAVIAQLSPLANEDCYQPKIYKAPSEAEELMTANAYVAYGLKIQPGSIIWGIFLDPSQSFAVQITDQELKHPFFSEPVNSIFISNDHPVAFAAFANIFSNEANFLDAPHPVTGEGLFLVEIWNNSGSTERIQVVFGVLEPIR
jgi:hypothetical protein